MVWFGINGLGAAASIVDVEGLGAEAATHGGE
jgi:hypothetical protein